MELLITKNHQEDQEESGRKFEKNVRAAKEHPFLTSKNLKRNLVSE